MDQTLLNHLLQLAAKTGDRLIVVDPDSRQPFVLMEVSQYEQLVGSADLHADRERGSRADQTGMGMATAAPVFDPIVQRANAELAAWRAAQQVTVPAAQASIGGFVPEPLQSATTDDDRFYVEPLE